MHRHRCWTFMKRCTPCSELRGGREAGWAWRCKAAHGASRCHRSPPPNPLPCLPCCLAPCSDAALMPFATPPAAAAHSPLHACVVVNLWLLLAVNVALPLALLQLLEQRSRAARPPGQEGRAPTGQEAGELQHGVPSVLQAYLTSASLWCAASGGLWVWLAAGGGSD